MVTRDWHLFRSYLRWHTSTCYLMPGLTFTVRGGSTLNRSIISNNTPRLLQSIRGKHSLALLSWMVGKLPAGTFWVRSCPGFWAYKWCALTIYLDNHWCLWESFSSNFFFSAYNSTILWSKKPLVKARSWEQLFKTERKLNFFLVFGMFITEFLTM